MALNLLAVILILLLHPNTPESKWFPDRRPSPANPTPLCASQFALANRACSRLPYTQVPPPAPPSPPSPEEDGPESRHRHRQRHRHGHGHRHRETPAEGECCRWLKVVDNVCVCELLVHLPPFLIWPVHNYTVVVDDSCDVTFRCGSRLVRF